MKKYYYYLFTFALTFGAFFQTSYTQEVENPPEVLVETNWYLRTLIIQGESKDFIPDQSASRIPLKFYAEVGYEEYDGSLTTKFCDEDSVLFKLQGDNELVTSGWGILARPFETSNCDYMTPPPENGATAYQYFVLFWENNYHSNESGIFGSIYHYTYTINEIESGYELTITNDIGVVGIFRNTYLGVEEDVLSQVKLYPNPVENFLQIDNLPTKTEYEVYDLSGKLVFQKSLSDGSDQIDLSFLTEGMYVYRLKDEYQNFQTGKLIKK